MSHTFSRPHYFRPADSTSTRRVDERTQTTKNIRQKDETHHSRAGGKHAANLNGRGVSGCLTQRSFTTRSSRRIRTCRKHGAYMNVLAVDLSIHSRIFKAQNAYMIKCASHWTRTPGPAQAGCYSHGYKRSVPTQVPDADTRIFHDEHRLVVHNAIRARIGSA